MLIRSAIRTCLLKRPKIRRFCAAAGHSAVHDGTPTAAPPLELHTQLTFNHASSRLRNMHAAFQRTFREQQDAPPSVDSNLEALQEWMQTFYRRPRGDLLLGAFAQALVTPGAFVRENSLPASVFLSVPLRHMLTTRAEVDTFMSAIISATQLPGAPSSFGAEHVDTILRALYACECDHMDTYLSDTSAAWQLELSNSKGSEGEAEDDLLALARSLLPPPAMRNRQHILSWNIPSLSISRFESTLKQQMYPVYGATRFWFMHTLAAHRLAATDTASFAVYVPRLAQHVTCAMVDAYWAHFYATGDAAVIGRVLDVGTPYIDYMEEYGDVYVKEYHKFREEPGEGVESLPPEFDDDPVGCMRFETSRYALWTLLMHAGTHTRVGEAFFEQLTALGDAFAMLDPVSRDETITAVGRSRLELMQLMEPAMSALLHRASQGGIGSGEWPARLALPSAAAAALPAPLTVQGIASAPVLSSVPIQARVPNSGLRAAGSVAEVMSTFKDRSRRSPRKR